MKVLVFFALFAVSYATPMFHAPSVVSTGESNQYNSKDTLGNYNFGYNEAHLSGGSFRKETGDAYGNKFGSYGLQEADGRTRVVSYVADSKGFRADIKTNEPGVEAKDPAATTINKALYTTYTAPAPSVTYTVATSPAKTYAAPPLTYAISSSPAKTYAVAPPLTYAVATSPAKTYAAAPSTFSYAYAPTTYKTYAPAPSTFAYSYGSAPVSTTYTAAAAPISYAMAPSSYKTYGAAPAHTFTYAAAPAPFSGYSPIRFFSGPALLKRTTAL